MQKTMIALSSQKIINAIATFGKVTQTRVNAQSILTGCHELTVEYEQVGLESYPLMINFFVDEVRQIGIRKGKVLDLGGDDQAIATQIISLFELDLLI